MCGHVWQHGNHSRAAWLWVALHGRCGEGLCLATCHVEVCSWQWLHMLHA